MPTATEMALVAGMALSMPFFRMPPVMATLAKLFAAPRTKVPAPAFVRAVPVVAPVMTPLMVLVTAGLVTVMVRPAAPRFMAPERMTPLPATRPPKVKSPLTVVALPIVRTVPSLRSEVPPAMTSVPVPTGPEVTGPPVLPAPNIRPPWFRLKPVVKVLAPLRARTPAPLLLSVVKAPLAIGAEIFRPVSARPAFTVMTGLALPNDSAENVAAAVLMVGVVAMLLFVAVMAFALLRVRVLSAVGVANETVGLPVPPSLLKVMLSSVCEVPTV